MKNYPIVPVPGLKMSKISFFGIQKFGLYSAAYQHFVLQLHPDAAEADYYRRAVRQPPAQITFDLNRQSDL